MDGQMNEPSAMHTGQQASPTYLQVHPQLQVEGPPGVQVQPSLPEPAVPVLHPSLQTQTQPQPVAEVQSQNEVLQVEHPQEQPQITEISWPVAVSNALPISNVPMAQAPPVLTVPAPPGVTARPEPALNGDSPIVTATDSTPTADGISELQDRAKLAASRVRLMDATIDVLVTTFKNKYALDKLLEKRCAKLLKASVFETSDKDLKEDLQVLAESSQWVKGNLRYLDQCLHEKHRNVQIAGPLADAKSERKKEEKQTSTIHKYAGKIGQRAMKRDEKEMKRGAKNAQSQIVEGAWKELPPASGQ